MPNRQHHVGQGAAVGAVAAVAQYLSEVGSNANKQFDFGELLGRGLLGYGFGVIGGVLPDLLEPAYLPNHRKFAHSFTAGSALIYGAVKSHDDGVHPAVRLIVLPLVAGYTKHLLDDAEIPKGISFI